VTAPDLKALRLGDADAWDQAFRWLWPTAFAVAQLKLQPFLPADIEDVAIESLEELVEKVREIGQVEELKPLAASIAHHRAISRLREHFAKKRGGGQTESLEARRDTNTSDCDPAGGDSPVDKLGQTELAELLGNVQTDLKPEQRAIISDFFLHGLTYEELAGKHGIAVGSVGVYLKRGLEGIRRWGRQHPEPLQELKDFLR
jgi:RNA polymerase sigma factor (sigma-70 family)